nr:endo-1,4-beta-xylanase [Halorubellus sp. JP-L1]
MTDHEYDFGSVVNAWKMADDSPEAQTYREQFREHFNKASIENGLKWDAWEDTHHRAATLETLEWLESNDVPVRGHTLIWPDFANTPDRIAQYSDDPDALHRAIAEHIRDEAGALSGRLTSWDVINEPYTSDEITDTLGRGSLVDWLEIAREADPETPRVVNDWGFLYEGSDEKREWYANLLDFLQSNDATLDGIGMQAHFSMHNKTRPGKVVDIIDRYASRGLDVEITEWDFRIDDPSSDSQLALQADYTRDMLTAVFSHPATTSFVGWGFWEGQMYHSSGAYFREDWSVKPNGCAYLDLVFDEWWTEETGTTSDDGSYQTRAFRGDYEITVEHGGTTKTVEATVSEGGSTVTVDVPSDEQSRTVETRQPSKVTKKVATFSGELTALGDASEVDCYFLYRVAGSYFWFATDVQSLDAPGTFETTIRHLRPDIEYEYYAVARTSDGKKQTGDTVTFRTKGNRNSEK